MMMLPLLAFFGRHSLPYLMQNYLKSPSLSIRRTSGQNFYSIRNALRLHFVSSGRKRFYTNTHKPLTECQFRFLSSRFCITRDGLARLEECGGVSRVLRISRNCFALLVNLKGEDSRVFLTLSNG